MDRTAPNWSGRLAPLPDHYYSLSPEEKRAARVNAIQSARTPEQVVVAWEFFRGYYLNSMDEGKFYKRRVTSPDTHYQWIHSMAKYARNFIAAPRSFAKSIVVGKEWPLFLALSRPGIEILTVVAEKSKATRRGQDFMRVLIQNPRVKEDFGDLKGKPRRDGRAWSFTSLALANGSTLHVTSIGARHLGDRPDVLIWDDVEPDPQLYKEAWEQIVDDLVSALFNVFLPMLDAGTQMVVIGTLLHRRSFLYWAMHSNDVRLGYWNRILSAIIDENGKPTWPEKFNEAAIARLKEELGPAAFAAQYMNAPMSDEACVLRVHTKRTGYDVTQHDDLLVTRPLESKALIHFYNTKGDKDASENSPDWITCTHKYGDFVTNMTRFITVDYAEGQNDLSDYSVVTVLGLDSKDNLWVLDMYVGRPTLHQLCNTIWNMSYKWKVHVLGVEAIGIYQTLYQWVVAQRGGVEKKMGWVPRIKKIQYPAHLSKPTRIASLEWRFDEGRIKILNNHTGVWKMLRFQIENFTPNLKNLRFDDVIDTVSMAPYVIVAKVENMPHELQDSARVTFAERLAKGNLVDKATGIPYITGMNAVDIPYHALRDALDSQNEKLPKGSILDKLPDIFTLADLANVLPKPEDDSDDAD